MSGIFYQPEIPYLLSTKLDISEEKRKRMVECVETQMPYANYHGGYTFAIRDPHNDFSWLYNTCFAIVKDLFGPFTLSVKQKNCCWANVYNKDGYNGKGFISNMHHHLRTSTINLVYYLNIPNDEEKNTGGLMILHENREYIFYPDNMDLLIMPSWLPHEPLPHRSPENRIAINMEISTVESCEEVFPLNKVFENCKCSLNLN